MEPQTVEVTLKITITGEAVQQFTKFLQEEGGNKSPQEIIREGVQADNINFFEQVIGYHAQSLPDEISTELV